MATLAVEILGTHGCTGYRGEIPELVRRFADDTGASIETHVYRTWDVGSREDVPEHVWQKVTAIREGRESSDGFFLNGQWLPLSAHNPQEAVAARQSLANALGLEPESTDVTLFGRQLEKVAVRSSTAKAVRIGNSTVSELGVFGSQFDRVVFFEGSIKSLAVNCAVEQLRFQGYDILKLISIAAEHPDLFQSARLKPNTPDGARVDIADVTVKLLTQEDLSSGQHPCVINGGKLDCASAFHQASAARCGGWGYAAMHGSKVCGFLGIAPKDVAQRDAAGFLPPAEFPPERTLLLTCLAGGGVFGRQYAGIGVATKIVRQAVRDAQDRGFLCVEGNPHDPGIGRVLERCGFRRVEWSGGGNSALREQAFYRLDLAAPAVS